MAQTVGNGDNGEPPLGRGKIHFGDNSVVG